MKKERYQRLGSHERSLRPVDHGHVDDDDEQSRSYMERLPLDANDDDDDVPEDEHRSTSSGHGPLGTLDTSSNAVRRMVQNARRQDRRNSRGSYTSMLSGGSAVRGDILSDEDDVEDNVVDLHHHESSNDNHNSSSHGDLHSYLSGERSPLNATSFDDEDHPPVPAPASQAAGSPPRGSSRPTSPKQQTSAKNSVVGKPSSVSHRVFSFGLDDDDDDFEDEYDIHLKRYAIDFSTHKDRSSGGSGGGAGAGNTPSSLTNSIHDNSSGWNGTGARSIMSPCGIILKIVPYLWFQFQTTRLQARQRRAQLLLQQSERHWKQSLYICLVTNLCDATDGGIALAAIGITLWILLLWQVTTVPLRQYILMGGVALWMVRFGSRPVYEYCLFRRRRWRAAIRRRQQQQGQHHRRSHLSSIPTEESHGSRPISTNRFSDQRPEPNTWQREGRSSHSRYEDDTTSSSDTAAPASATTSWSPFVFATGTSPTAGSSGVMELSQFTNGSYRDNDTTGFSSVDNEASPSKLSSLPASTDPTIRII